MRIRIAFFVVICLLFGCDDSNFNELQIQSGIAFQAPPNEREREILSDPFHVNQLFESMAGPFTRRRVRVVRANHPQLLWLTGFRVESVDATGTRSESDEFECHTNLAWTRDRDPRGFNRPRRRAFTLTQGQTDVRLPPGFGIPFLSSEALLFNSQALNITRPEIDVTIRHRAKIRFVPEADVVTPMKPLVVAAAQVMTTLEAEATVLHVAQPNGELAQASCSIGESAHESDVMRDRFGRRFTPHWIVKPGRQEARTLVTQQLGIPYDTTIHFIGVHVHPYSVSLELQDMTTGKTVWKSYQNKKPDQLGLSWMDYFSSEEGLPIYRDHAYQLISIYDNPTDQDSSAMASIFIYYRDKQFGYRPTSTASVRHTEVTDPS